MKNALAYFSYQPICNADEGGMKLNMTIHQKLDAFAKRIKDDIDTKRRQEAKEIQDAIAQAIQDAESEAKRASNEQLRIELAKLERESNKKIYAANTKARQQLFELKESQKNEILYELETNLRNFTKSPEYKTFLQDGIDSTSTDAFATIILMPQDTVDTSLVIEKSEEDFIGGFKLQSADKRVMTDYSLQKRLGELSDEDFWN